MTVGLEYRSETRALLRAYHEDGDLAARERLITEGMTLVRALARRYAQRGEQLEDLVQVGSIGLIKAIDRFDIERGVELTTFAVPVIVGELKRHFRDRVWSVSVPRRLKELHLALGRLLDDLTAELGRSPTVSELAAASGADEEEVVEALELGRAYSARSLSAPTARDDGSESGHLVDTLADGRNAYAGVEARILLSEAVGILDEREKQIVHLRFFEGLTQSQIAVRLGISQMHVSRLIRKALDKLGAEIEP
jgi:RNA polymerase sigma-B factor